MDTQAIRKAFSDFLGKDRYNTFVEGHNPTERLRFWQEEAWRTFVIACPESAVTMEELRAALYLCARHDLDLIQGTMGQWYCPKCHEEKLIRIARDKAAPSLFSEMRRPHHAPDEGLPVPDLIEALRAIENSDKVPDKAVMSLSLHPNGMIMVTTGGRTGGSMIVLRRDETGWEVAESGGWCS
ncbi:hypothetical protein [Singulisphaera sp. PoT]|uniref:hypothetical protein n=1 Tax=Singulisphaera sp. PoT TaxID=3411797 RepID=UPI003BF61243